MMAESPWSKMTFCLLAFCSAFHMIGLAAARLRSHILMSWSCSSGSRSGWIAKASSSKDRHSRSGAFANDVRIVATSRDTVGPKFTACFLGGRWVSGA